MNLTQLTRGLASFFLKSILLSQCFDSATTCLRFRTSYQRMMRAIVINVF